MLSIYQKDIVEKICKEYCDGVEENGKTIFETKMSENGDATFKKPSGDYTVILDAGEGHEVYIKSKDISK